MAPVGTGTVDGRPDTLSRPPGGPAVPVARRPAPFARSDLLPPAAALVRAGGWVRGWQGVLVAGDAFALGLALLAGLVPPGPGPDGGTSWSRLPCLAVAGGLAVAWLTALAVGGCYRVRNLGAGAAEYRQVAGATFRLWAAVGLACYAVRAERWRGLVVVAVPLGLAALLGWRALARRRLAAQRRAGRMLHRVVVVAADRASAAELCARLGGDPAAGFGVVGVCLTRADGDGGAPAVPVTGTLDDLPHVLRACRADTVAVAAPHVRAETVRSVARRLEGSGAALVVAPAVAGVACSRVSVRPVGDLPLVQVDGPVLAGGRRLVKDVLDRLLAAIGLLLLAPLMGAVAAAVRLTSPGPALFRQRRVGRGGREFEVLKFRTMARDAERQLAHLLERNESDGLLFKLRDDPRVTRLGALLRRTSLDELPQLVNVLRGEMSLVGPRPLPVRDADFRGEARRRLLVRPGITGLWQVSGRSRLSWEDAVRLDVYYVDNWSLGLDLAILARTVGAVLRGTGAY